MTDVGIKQKKERPREKKVHESGGRDERDAATSPGRLETTRDCKSKEGPFSGAIREARPC